MLNPRASGEFIASHARHVRVNPSGVENVAKIVVDGIERGTFSDASWTAASDLHPIATGPDDKMAANWCLFADAINFSFWSENDDEQKQSLFTVTYKGQIHNGWYACCALINRAIDNGVPFTDAEYVRRLSTDEARAIFTGDDSHVIPMCAERRKNLIETAEVLIEKFDGDFTKCFREAAKCGDAQTLLRIIVDNFPSFRDTAIYNGRAVSFLKRAQILVVDVFACFGLVDNSGSSLDTLTMFADYRVPQVLAYLGALDYSLELKDRLRKRHVFANGDPVEVEIRGCSIYAVDRIVELARKKKSSSSQLMIITAAGVDNFLWCYRRRNAAAVSAAAVPFHRTRCIYY